MFKTAIILLVAAFLGVAHHALSQQQTERPNIVWINVEDTSPALGCYGDSLAKTPNLDKLAKEGIRYENAYATAPICSPSRSSFITGVYSTAMGTQHLRSVVRRPDFIKTLPEILKEQGYFVTNYGKTDWNFSDEGVFNLRTQSVEPWKNRANGQPFFSMFVIGGTHEGAINQRSNYVELTRNLTPRERQQADGFPVPAFYPATPYFSEMWSRYYELLTAMDHQVGTILSNLERDGLKENTIVFFFSDHGFGMPRYKRYLYQTGLRVPLIVYLPPKYRHMSKVTAGSKDGQLVSLVDLTPSVLNMLGIKKPSYMQGQAFLGERPEAARKFVFGERSRADDLFEMSRAVLTNRYIYIRHYMPYLPYIRKGKIQGDEKDGYRGLIRLHNQKQLKKEMDYLFFPKVEEELYDLEADPNELHNLATEPKLQNIKLKLRNILEQWSIEHGDTGFLPEAEYMQLAADDTPYHVIRDLTKVDIGKIIPLAAIGASTNEKDIANLLKHPNLTVRYWAVIGSRNLKKKKSSTTSLMLSNFSSGSPALEIATAEALALDGYAKEALPVLARHLQDTRPWVALQAARSLVEIGELAKPVTQTMLEVQRSYLGTPGGKFKYRDHEYSSFVGWALETALLNCGVTPL